MLMPDTIYAYTAKDGIEYLVTANEGDDKVLLLETAVMFRQNPMSPDAFEITGVCLGQRGFSLD